MEKIAVGKFKLTKRRFLLLDGIVNKGMTQKDAAIYAGYSTANPKSLAATTLNCPTMKGALAYMRANKVVLPESEPRKDAPNKTGPRSGAPRGELDDYGIPVDVSDSLELLRAVYKSGTVPLVTRVTAAVQALPYEHRKLGDVGKREAKKQAAAAIAEADSERPRFGTGAPPMLHRVK